jgi:uncharacterized membrane protein
VTTARRLGIVAMTVGSSIQSIDRRERIKGEREVATERRVIESRRRRKVRQRTLWVRVKKMAPGHVKIVKPTRLLISPKPSLVPFWPNCLEI